jgi:hypothetical protein
MGEFVNVAILKKMVAVLKGRHALNRLREVRPTFFSPYNIEDFIATGKDIAKRILIIIRRY